MDDFAGLLHCYRTRAQRSCNDLARAVGVDPSYVSRLERGEREPPRRPVVERIAQSLAVNQEELDGLLVSAGYTPTALAQLGGWHRTLQLVATVLTDSRLPADDLEQFERIVEGIAARWQPLEPSGRNER